MRIGAFVIFMTCLKFIQGSAVASDLAILARSPGDHPAANLPGMKQGAEEVAVPKRTRSLVHKHESKHQRAQSETSSQQHQPLSLWRVRLALAIVVIAIVASLGALVVHSARVFGYLPDEKRESPLSPKADADPESLTRLLNMQSIGGYGAIFSNRGLIGSSPGADKPTIIIQ
jgi:hypothetical protein